MMLSPNTMFGSVGSVIQRLRYNYRNTGPPPTSGWLKSHNVWPSWFFARKGKDNDHVKRSLIQLIWNLHYSFGINVVFTWSSVNAFHHLAHYVLRRYRVTITRKPQTPRVEVNHSVRRVLAFKEKVAKSSGGLRRRSAVRVSAGDRRPYVPPSKREYVEGKPCPWCGKTVQRVFSRALSAAPIKKPSVPRDDTNPQWIYYRKWLAIESGLNHPDVAKRIFPDLTDHQYRRCLAVWEVCHPLRCGSEIWDVCPNKPDEGPTATEQSIATSGGSKLRRLVALGD